MKSIGVFCIILGAIFVFFALMMDTSVSSSITGTGRVHNLGLLAEQQNFLTISTAVLVIGVLLVIFGKRTEDVITSQSLGMRACPFCAEAIKNEAIKCKHCSSAVEPIIMASKTAEQEVADEYLVMIGATRSADGIDWQGTKYPTFEALLDVAERTRNEPNPQGSIQQAKVFRSSRKTG
jgi:hypothetical protein